MVSTKRNRRFPVVAVLCWTLAVASSFGAEEIDRQEVSIVLKSAAPGTMYYEDEPLAFHAAEPLDADYRVTDAYGKEVASGKMAGDRLALPTLPRGYYYLRLQSPTREFRGYRSFAVLPRRTEIPPEHHSPYAFVGCIRLIQDFREFNQTPYVPKNRFEVMCGILERSGVRVFREHSGWAQPERAGEYRSPFYDRLFPEVQKMGLTVNYLAQQGSSPKWMINPDKMRAYEYKGDRVPDDMVDVYDITRNLAKRYGGYFSMFEHVNEPELDLVALWDVASQFKASAYAMRKTAPRVKILSPSFCRIDQRYIELFLENGTAPYFDLFNYHFYTPIAGYADLLATLRESLGKYGIGGQGIVLTETSAGDADGDGKERSLYFPKVAEHSPDQEMLLAEATLKSQLISQKLGVHTNFSFILMPNNQYREGRKVWGFLRYDYTAKPALAAFANLMANLGAAEYLGVRDLGKEYSGLLFRQPDGTTTLAFWKNTRLDWDKRDHSAGLIPYDGPQAGTLALALPDGDYALNDVFGTPARLVARNGSLEAPVSRFPAYLHGVRGMTVTEKAASVGNLEAAVDPMVDPGIVLKLDFSTDFSIPAGRLISHAILKKGRTGRISLDIANLDAEEKVGRLVWQGGIVTGVPETITLKPHARTRLPLEYAPEPAGESVMAGLRFEGTFNGKKVTPLVAPVFPAGSLRAVDLPGSRDAARWRANAAGKMTIRSDADEPGAVVFTVDFDKHPWWASPEFLLDLPAESLADAKGIQFDIQCDPEGNSRVSLYPVVDTTPRHGKTVELRCAHITSDRWETKQAYFTQDDVKPRDIKMFRIAVAPKQKSVTFKIRNIRELRSGPDD